MQHTPVTKSNSSNGNVGVIGKTPNSSIGTNGNGVGTGGTGKGGVIVNARIEPVVPNDIQDFLKDIAFPGYPGAEDPAEKILTPSDLK